MIGQWRQLPHRLGVLGGFAVALALLGGTSRSDAWQLAVLLPVAWLTLGWAAQRFDSAMWDEYRPLWLILLAAAVLTGLQLVPLPEPLWHQLPTRDVVAALDASLGTGGWRPLSMEPSSTLVALLSFAVPLAALAIFAVADRAGQRRLVLAIVAIATVGAVLGLYQTFVAGGGPISWYEYPAKSALAGLFSNSNHAAVYGCVALLLIAHLIAQGESPRARSLLMISSGLIAASIVINSSRAGLLSFAVCGPFVVAIAAASTESGEGGIFTRRRILIYGLIAGALMLAIGTLFADRVPAFERLLSGDTTADARFAALPTFLAMARDHLLFGTGIGSFRTVYSVYESRELLSDTYMNMAHNDWLQIVIEGGVTYFLLGLAAIAGWLWMAGKMLFRGEDATPAALAMIGLGVVLALASAFDYPLRTPLFQATTIWIAGYFLRYGWELRNAGKGAL